jgi:NAD(P)-dependent dehydrogenase (short-subunit alcohol dehydrogenase family)
MQKGSPKKMLRSAQRQRKPGKEEKMRPLPVTDDHNSDPGKKLVGKVALITGGDSGIGRAVAICFAKHGADIAICCLRTEETDALETKRHVEEFGRKCMIIKGDVGSEAFCKSAVKRVWTNLKRIDILVNNAGMQIPQERVEDITSAQLKRTFAVNIFSMFYFVKAALRHMREGGVIINTASVTAYRGSAHLLDYSATKGAVVSFTRSLAALLVKKGIRANAVAPGPVWTPLIVSSMEPREVSVFGSDSPMARAAQPSEIAPCYLFLASPESVFVTGQVLHPNGGEVVNG